MLVFNESCYFALILWAFSHSFGLVFWDYLFLVGFFWVCLTSSDCCLFFLVPSVKLDLEINNAYIWLYHGIFFFLHIL